MCRVSRHVASWVSVGVAVAVCMAGCTSEPAAHAQARPTRTSGTAPTTTTAPDTAPTVTAPLDATRFVRNPCSALTPPEVEAAGMANALSQKISDPGGTGCGWADGSGAGIGVVWVTAATHGLSDVYRTSSANADFAPMTVAGYSAVLEDRTSAQQAQGHCSVDVAVNDHLYFFADYDDPANPSHVCVWAQDVATDVLQNLQG